MKARPTQYSGILFRSRLEAMWASWFDRNGFTWEYEPETTVSFSGLIYTPDFKISREGVCAFVEVKPIFSKFDLRTKRRVYSFINYKRAHGGCPRFVLLVGQPADSADYYTVFNGNGFGKIEKHDTLLGALGWYALTFSTECFTDAQYFDLINGVHEIYLEQGCVVDGFIFKPCKIRTLMSPIGKGVVVSMEIKCPAQDFQEKVILHE